MSWDGRRGDRKEENSKGGSMGEHVINGRLGFSLAWVSGNLHTITLRSSPLQTRKRIQSPAPTCHWLGLLPVGQVPHPCAEAARVCYRLGKSLRLSDRYWGWGAGETLSVRESLRVGFQLTLLAIEFSLCFPMFFDLS